MPIFRHIWLLKTKTAIGKYSRMYGKSFVWRKQPCMAKNNNVPIFPYCQQHIWPFMRRETWQKPAMYGGTYGVKLPWRDAMKQPSKQRRRSGAKGAAHAICRPGQPYILDDLRLGFSKTPNTVLKKKRVSLLRGKTFFRVLVKKKRKGRWLGERIEYLSFLKKERRQSYSI